MHLHLGCRDKTGKSTLCIAMYGRAAFSQWNELNPKGHGSNTFLTLDLKPEEPCAFSGLAFNGCSSLARARISPARAKVPGLMARGCDPRLRPIHLAGRPHAAWQHTSTNELKITHTALKSQIAKSLVPRWRIRVFHWKGQYLAIQSCSALRYRVVAAAKSSLSQNTHFQERQKRDKLGRQGGRSKGAKEKPKGDSLGDKAVPRAA